MYGEPGGIARKEGGPWLRVMFSVLRLLSVSEGHVTAATCSWQSSSVIEARLP